MKISSFIIALLFVASTVNAQDDGDETKKYNVYDVAGEDEYEPWKDHRIGFYASFMSGYGLAYQYHLGYGFAFKTQFFAYASVDDEDNSSDDEVILVWGGDVQYNIYRTQKYRFYALAGGYYRYRENRTGFNSFDNTDNYDYNRYLNFGLGVGVELKIFGSFTLVAEGGYYGKRGYISDYKQIAKDNEFYHGYEHRNPLEVGLGGGLGAFFSF